MNQMQLIFSARSENEEFARNAVASFILPLDPTLSELSDVKTAVSEAVTNCIVHAYSGSGEGLITLTCKTEDNAVHITVEDSGKGIEDVEQALTPFFSTLSSRERSGMGFTIMQTFMTDFSVTSKPAEGTVVKMSKRFGAGANTDAR